MNYKITLFRNNIYKEISLDEKCNETLHIGTDKECQIRFNRKNFFVDFVINLLRKNDDWVMTCCTEIYFLRRNGLKEYVAYPHPGDVIKVCYKKSDTELFSIEFSYDFSKKHVVYDNKIDISKLDTFTIGGRKDCAIHIEDEILDKDFVLLKQNVNGYEIEASHCKYKVFINGYQSETLTISVKNKTFLGITGYNFFLDKGIIIAENDENISTELSNSRITYQKNSFMYPKYIENVRQRYIVPKEKLKVLNPKSKPAEPKKNILLSILPTVASMGLMFFMRGGMSSGSGMYMLYMPAIMGIGVAVSIITYISTGKQYKKDMIKREDVYIQYIEKQEEKIEKLRDKERKILLLKYTLLKEKLDYVEDFSARLFEKTSEDEDYLQICIGKGKNKSICEIEYTQEDYVDTQDPLRDYPKLVHDKYKYMKDIPVTIDLKIINGIGFVGTRQKLYEMLKNIMLSIAIEHFYQEVKIAVVLNEEDEERFKWSRWLKNLWNESFNGRNIVHDEESSKVMIEYLYLELNKREQQKQNGTTKFAQNYVVFVYRSDIIAGHPVVKYMKNAASLGFTFLFFEEYEERLNKACDYKIYLKSQKCEGIIQSTHNGEEVQKFTYEEIADKEAEKAARKLAPVYIDEVSLESSLTKNITLYELLKIMSVEDIDLEKRWHSSKIYESMAAPLGVSSGNNVVSLDLHEKFHGPHGLVAGTTGSGKSEILQSYILSMATLFHPYEVGFIIIDFKGGGMVNQFRKLPHLNGAITNIDGREIDRSLKSIKAELQKRQKLFAAAGVNHIDDYIKEYKKKNAKTPLPHLILIVDEFAELKSEQPDFMKELISAARIGRSLGVHLILATQKPSGVVDAQIWSNSRFKLCLKVQDESDSREVLKSPLAAEIREPGRAYLQVGNNEIFKLFQSAYSGAPARFDSMGLQKKYKICKVGLGGEREIIYEEKAKKQEDGVTQLDVMVDYIEKYCSNKGIKKLPEICLPSLADNIPFSIEKYENKTKDICVPIGVLDDPTRQLQKVTDINITQNNVMIIGSSQSGKTNMLQTIIRGITTRYTAKDVNIYVLDFATMILKNMERLRQVGGVVTSREDEKLKNFFKMIMAIMEERKSIMSKLGLSSFSTYREAGYNEMPQIVFIVDNVIALKELFPNSEEYLLTILRDGLPLGISSIFANSQTRGFGFKMQSNFSKKIAMYCNDSGEYSSLFEKTKMTLANIRGRCLTEENRETYECQTYMAFTAEKEIDKIKEIKAYIEEINKKNKVSARSIPEIPACVTEEYMEERFGEDVSGKDYRIEMGLSFATTEAVYLDMLKEKLIGIISREDLGKEDFIKHIVQKLSTIREEEPSEVYIIDDIERSLSGLKDTQVVKTYSINPESVKECLETVNKKLEERYERMMGGKEQSQKEAMQVIILNSPESYEVVNDEASELFENIVTKFKKQKVCVLITNMQNAGIGFSSPKPVKAFREGGNIIAFEDLSEVKVVDLPFKVVKENKKAIQKGECYYIKGSEVTKIKTVIPKND